MNTIHYKVKNLLVLFFLIAAFASCKTSFGEKYERGNLIIFYTTGVGIEYVEALADYYEEHELIGEEAQSIQLTKYSETFLLKLILKKDPDEIIRNQIKLLELDLKEKVFRERALQIQLCDQFFNVKE